MGLLASFLLVFEGCGSDFKYTVYYSPAMHATKSAHSIRNSTINIWPLRDTRAESPINRIILNAKDAATFSGRRLCVNGEHGYEKKSVSLSISELIAAHCRARQSFQQVTMGTSDIADYYLGAELYEF